MARRRYTKSDRILAVVAADMTNSDAAEASTGIPARTIRRWRDDPEMAEFIRKTREDLADDIRVAAATAWDLLIRRIKAGEVETRDLIVAAGVAVDKSQLLSGAATARTETRDLTGTLSDSDVAAIVREAEQITGSGGTAEAPAGEAAG